MSSAAIPINHLRRDIDGFRFAPPILRCVTYPNNPFPGT